MCTYDLVILIEKWHSMLVSEHVAGLQTSQTRFCKIIHMDETAYVQMKLLYYQANKFHIILVFISLALLITVLITDDFLIFRCVYSSAKPRNGTMDRRAGCAER